MDSGDSVDGSPDEPKTPNRGRSKKTKKETESVLKQKSPAEFFAENKNIAGFDNFFYQVNIFFPHQPGKSLYTTIRELVENALDSAEAISQLPDIELVMIMGEECHMMRYQTCLEEFFLVQSMV
ncbi:DNA topoisomerase 6 subunit B-like isoform X1 [Zingiber officinale]|uniref:DNA topoisomerase 6 subunit B-like isoform X1 n=1 Tax=Zingiber officinale TaxID=94328 RepID=UPI001C4CE9FC|nr:DNA topoisomerase 6 subunit B-like isoform X1 [Zingiber officinale]XP_042391447.1 DNA topoisomerase 6 subunit B-like isoform X1 [Zingiber officinale]